MFEPAPKWLPFFGSLLNMAGSYILWIKPVPNFPYGLGSHDIDYKEIERQDKSRRNWQRFGISLAFIGFLISSASGFAQEKEVQVAAHLSKWSGFKDEKISISSGHSIDIFNHASHEKNYKYIYSLCSDKNDCRYKTKAITIAPMSVAHLHDSINVDVTFDSPGNHFVRASTVISGDESAKFVTASIIPIYKRPGLTEKLLGF